MAAQTQAGVPYPGDELAFRVSGQTDPYAFSETGRMSRESLERALKVIDRTFADFERALDFGCGCGRITAWLQDVAQEVDIHGVDIDERAIAWAREHIPWASFTTNGTLPPLDCAGEQFDLVLNHSVFSHLDVDYQDRWLEELRRVTRPGAILVLSVDGEYGFRQFEHAVREQGADPSPFREQFERDGILFIKEDDWFGTALPDCYHSTFHAPWYVFEHWSRWFEVRGYLPRNALGRQDHVVLERLADGEKPMPYSSRRSGAEPEPPGGPSGSGGALGRLEALAPGVTARARRRLRIARIALRETPAGEIARRGVIQQSERLNRLEKELLARLDALEERVDRSD